VQAGGYVYDSEQNLETSEQLKYRDGLLLLPPPVVEWGRRRRVRRDLFAAEGHPSAVMDMSFANQALCAEYIAQNHKTLERTIYAVPEEIDRNIARLKLKAMGMEIDTLTDEQTRYLTSWEEGT